MAALDAQHQHESANGTQMTTLNGGAAAQIEPATATGAIVAANGIINGSIVNCSPKDLRKLDQQKKRWKTWGWKYSPGGKTSSIEEEPPDSPKQPSSKHSSPANSPKHKKSDTLSSSSPLRRQKSPSPSSSSGLRNSAGARLCQLIDDSQDESGDELQALLINGRPASVHIVPNSSSSSGKSLQ